MKMIKVLWWMGIVVLGLASPVAMAALDIELTKGVEGSIPIAIVPFEWGAHNEAPLVDIAAVISADLAMSGRFNALPRTAISQLPHTAQAMDYKYWQQKNVDDVVVGRVIPLGNDQYRLEFTLLNVYKGKSNEADSGSGHVIVAQSFSVSARQLRRAAHHISDLIYQQLTGEHGIFSTRLAYVLVQRQFTHQPSYLLEVADVDGHNAVPILHSDEPIMSPAWSPEGRRIAYVSFEGKRPRIYVSEVATGRRQLVTSFPGINGAPAWSPDGTRMALALSKTGNNPNIYVMNLATKQLEQITRDSAINTEPSWSPDGKNIIFTSDRGGSPQIYQINLASRQIKRLTFDGNYNASASYTADGKNLVMLHRDRASFNIAMMDVRSGGLRELTRTGKDESPSVAPNGKMIVFARYWAGRSSLGMVSADGRVKLTLPSQNGNVQEPDWSPFLK